MYSGLCSLPHAYLTKDSDYGKYDEPALGFVVVPRRDTGILLLRIQHSAGKDRLFTRNNSYFSQSEEMNGMDVTMFILFSWLPYLNAERTTTETSRAIKYGLYVPYLSEIALAS